MSQLIGVDKEWNEARAAARFSLKVTGSAFECWSSATGLSNK
jgi:uncharacterized protein YhjY with autotransporter beta-barrel domain